MDTYRILVTGSRNWLDQPTLCGAINAEIATAIDQGLLPVIVHGHCPTGADAMADAWAASLGCAIERHPAQWVRYGKAAGPIRNGQMVCSEPDVCLAFIRNGSRGATGCAAAAEDSGITTRRYLA